MKDKPTPECRVELVEPHIRVFLEGEVQQSVVKVVRRKVKGAVAMALQSGDEW